MSNFLKTIYFIGHHLIVNEVCHQQKRGLKSDQSLSTLQKYMKCPNTTALKQKSNFLIVNFRMRQKLAFIRPLIYKKHKIVSFVL